MTTNISQLQLTDLFHYDPAGKKGGDLPKALREYQFLLKASEHAIQHLLDGNLEKFDALVGENACHIRAIKITMIASKDKSNFIALKDRLSEALIRVEALFESVTIKRLMYDRLSLKAIIEGENLEISLNSEEIYIIKSFILSEMKELEEEEEYLSSLTKNEKSNPEKLLELTPNITGSFLFKLSNQIRKLLSHSSVNFVKNIASELQDPHLYKMISEYLVEHNSRSCTPTFWTFKTLFLYAQRNGIPIVLHVKFLNKTANGLKTIDEEFIHFKPCKISNSYRNTEMSKDDYNRPACVIEGIAFDEGKRSFSSKEEWKRKIKEIDLLDMIFAGAAHHRQYPDPNINIDLFDEEYENFRKLAETQGYSLDNPSLFFMRHIYSAQVKNFTF